MSLVFSGRVPLSKYDVFCQDLGDLILALNLDGQNMAYISNPVNRSKKCQESYGERLRENEPYDHHVTSCKACDFGRRTPLTH